MKTAILALALISIIAVPALADKPEWAGKGKPTAEQKEAHRAAMQAKEGSGDEMEESKDKMMREKEKKAKTKKERTEDMAKPHTDKTEQVQKELDKGSEKGQEARETRKKWWNFWGE